LPKARENAERDILESASRLLRSQGYRRTDMRQIARESGVAVGTLYNYYRDKQQLLEAVVARSRQIAQRAVVRIAGARERDAADRLRGVLRRLVLAVQEDGPLQIELLRVLRRQGEDPTSPSGDIRRLQGQLREMLEGLLAEIRLSRGLRAPAGMDRHWAALLLGSTWLFRWELPEAPVVESLFFIDGLVSLLIGAEGSGGPVGPQGSTVRGEGTVP
jgi:AcrR family transcriptional regulator